MALQQIKRIVVHDAIIENVITYIREKELQPGERIPSERSLSASLAVSRSSIREALKSLESAGILEIRHGGGAYFKSQATLEAYGSCQYDGDQRKNLLRLNHLLAARRLIEERVVFEVTPGLKDHQIQSLFDLENQQFQAQIQGETTADPSCELPNMTLELAITALLENPVILEMHQRLEPQWKQAFRNIGALPFTPEERHNPHQAILEAMAGRNPHNAQKAMVEHNLILEQFLKTKLQNV